MKIGAYKPWPAIIFLLSFSSLSEANNVITTADSLFKIRAEGSITQRALIEPAHMALMAYNHATTVFPDTISLHWKRLRAFHFILEFVELADSNRTKIVSRAKSAADSAISKVHTTCDKEFYPSENKTNYFSDCSASNIAGVYFWSAINWGIWSRSQEALTTKIKVTKRIFRYTEKALALDPTVDNGGSQRLLSVLHATIPSVPFITGFINKNKVMPLINEALALYPNHPGNRLLKAKAMMNQDPSQRDSSRYILNGIVNETPNGPWRVEWHKIRALANKLLGEKNNIPDQL